MTCSSKTTFCLPAQRFLRGSRRTLDVSGPHVDVTDVTRVAAVAQREQSDDGKKHGKWRGARLVVPERPWHVTAMAGGKGRQGG